MNEIQKTPAEMLATPVQFLKGAGPQRAELLARLGVHRALDLLYFFPRDYQDLASLASVADLTDGALVRLQGSVVEFDLRESGAGKSILGVLVKCQGGHVRLLWFNQPFMKDRFAVGQQVLVAGKVRFHGLVWEFSHPQVQWLDFDESVPTEELLPVYPLTEGLNQRGVRAMVRQAVETHAPLIEETFPAEYLAAHDLWPIGDAIRGIHNPRSREELAAARRRFVYQELLVLQLALGWKRHVRTEQRQAPAMPVSAKIDARIRRLFPFEFTAAQNQAIAEVTAHYPRHSAAARALAETYFNSGRVLTRLVEEALG